MSDPPALGAPVGSVPPLIVTTASEADVSRDQQPNATTLARTGEHSPSPSPAPSYQTLTLDATGGASPTSVRFDGEKPKSSLALRDNHPTASSGLDTLSPNHKRTSSQLTHGSNEVSEKPSHSIDPAQAALTKDDGTFEAKTGKKPQEVEEAEAKFRQELEAESGDSPAPFATRPKKLASLVDPKNIPALMAMGGVDGLLEGLGTDFKKGLDRDVLASTSTGSSAATANAEERKRVYGANTIPVRPVKSLFYLMYLALKDKVLIILCIAAVISLALGLYSALGTEPKMAPNAQGILVSEPQVDWVEGLAIMVAVVIVVLVGSVNDWQKEKQFQKLNAKKEDREVKVIRSGNEEIISVYELLVGDIALLEPGEIIPVDGVFLRGHSVKCDESGATGESDAIKKVSYEECLAEREGQEESEKGFKNDCFMVSGGKILEGVGEYVVIAVGVNSFNGRTLMALSGDAPPTPLQLKLNALAELIAKLGSLAGLILFSALLIRFFVSLGKGTPPMTATEKGEKFVDILIISVTVIVVAVPEGLPLAVTLALAFATKRMTKENLLVRLLGACETMANANVVCTDKTGTLTQNVMSVVAGSIGVHGKFVLRLQENAKRSNANATVGENGEIEGARKGRQDFALEQSDVNTILSPAVQDLFNDALVLNSTAFESKNSETGELEFVGSKTETALLRFAKELGWKDYKSARDGAEVLQMIPFASERKSMGVVVRLPNGKARLYLKGASEILLRMSTKHIVVGETIESEEIQTADFEDETRQNIDKTIILYANNMLRTIAVCYRDFESWPPAEVDEEGNAAFSWLARDLTLIAVTGIEDPLRPGVTEAVATAGRAGVAIKMCTGDNVLTARSIATQCGIYTPGGIIMEGPVFRALSPADRHLIVPRLQVLARSSPEDKKILVQSLQDLAQIVAVTGDGTNDAPALKQADVGFSMGIAGTEVAKSASDIILMTDDFPSIVTAIMWGRCVNDSVRKFLQFQISVNITAVVITFISAVASEEEESVLTAVQLLWVNLIMDTFAALALATDPATPESLNRLPDAKTAPLITIDMFKMILGQALFQILACLILHFVGQDIIYGSCSSTFECNRDHALLTSTVFNTFVFCQVFNQFNCRRLDRGLNIFTQFFRNTYFLVIFAIMVGGQTLIVFVGGAAFSVVRIGGKEWAISIIIAMLSLPLGVIIRLLPTEPFARFLYRVGVYSDPAKLPKESAISEQLHWNEAIDKSIGHMTAYTTIRGGRFNAHGIPKTFKSRSSQLKKQGIEPTSLLAIIPSLIASSVGAGWTPQDREGGLDDPAGPDPSASSAALASGKIQIHPGTPHDDPYWIRFGQK